MPNNYTYGLLEIEEVARIARAQGLECGKILKQWVKDGTIEPGQTVNLEIDLENIDFKRFSLLTRATMAMGTTKAGVLGNSAIVCLGTITAGNSLIGYGITTNKKAKMLYAASTVFAASAIVNGGTAVASRTCHISGAAALSEAFGFACLKLGNKVHVMALQLEGKAVPPKLQKYMTQGLRRPQYPDGLGFIIPGSCSPGLSGILEYIPFEKIGRLVGFGVAVYGYSKVVIAGYRYSQQWISKTKANKKSALIRKQATFLVRCSVRIRVGFLLRRNGQNPLFYREGL